MAELVRFGVSLDRDVLARFDERREKKGCPTRSKAIEDLIRRELAEKAWATGAGVVAGALTVVYNHHKRELVTRLLDLQHRYHHLIVSTQHVHLSHDDCLEIIVVKGAPRDIRKLVDAVSAEKGVTHTSLTVTPTGGDHVH